ncbi:MAG: hypothetical protein JWM99_3682, partial [Verrucomicrobiales bacterium]|nr:hypothetical protein [Verrucomicrobiales bacterium]
ANLEIIFYSVPSPNQAEGGSEHDRENAIRLIAGTLD